MLTNSTRVAPMNPLTQSKMTQLHLYVKHQTWLQQTHYHGDKKMHTATDSIQKTNIPSKNLYYIGHISFLSNIKMMQFKILVICAMKFFSYLRILTTQLRDLLNSVSDFSWCTELSNTTLSSFLEDTLNKFRNHYIHTPT